MTLETFLTYALRLWWAGALYTGVFLVRIGPFVLAVLGFVGWQWGRGSTPALSPRKTAANHGRWAQAGRIQKPLCADPLGSDTFQSLHHQGEENAETVLN